MTEPVLLTDTVGDGAALIVKESTLWHCTRSEICI